MLSFSPSSSPEPAADAGRRGSQGIHIANLVIASHQDRSDDMTKDVQRTQIVLSSLGLVAAAFGVAGAVLRERNLLLVFFVSQLHVSLAVPVLMAVDHSHTYALQFVLWFVAFASVCLATKLRELVRKDKKRDAVRELADEHGRDLEREVRALNQHARNLMAQIEGTSIRPNAVAVPKQRSRVHTSTLYPGVIEPDDVYSDEYSEEEEPLAPVRLAKRRTGSALARPSSPKSPGPAVRSGMTGRAPLSPIAESPSIRSKGRASRATFGRYTDEEDYDSYDEDRLPMQGRRARSAAPKGQRARGSGIRANLKAKPGKRRR